MDKKQFALEQIAPYYKDPSLCGIDKTGSCMNLTPDGKMCVAGKNLLPKIREVYKPISISNILHSENYVQSRVFIPSSVDILSTDEWKNLQSLHDTIAIFNDDSMINDNLGLFTFQELKDYCKTI